MAMTKKLTGFEGVRFYELQMQGFFSERAIVCETGRNKIVVANT